MLRALGPVFLLVCCAIVAAPAAADDESVSIAPSAPTELDPITVTLSGVASSSCTPELVGAEVVGNRVEIEATLQPGRPETCQPVATPYAVSIDIGRLPAGDWVIDVSGIPTFPPPITVAQLDIEVVASAALGLEAIDVAPERPTAQDRFVVAASGTWEDGCIPRFDTVVVDDDSRTISLYAIAQGEGCPLVISRYFVASAVGPVAQGEWEIEVLIADRRFGDTGAPHELAGSRSLTVGERSSDVLLLGGRFGVTVTWNDGGMQNGVAQPIRGAFPDRGETGTGAFWFFDPENTELLIKVLDGCELNGHYWVFISAATDLGYEVLVEDFGVDGQSKSYTNVAGETAVATTDVEAFATCRAP